MDSEPINVTPHTLAVLLFAHALRPFGLRHATTLSGQCHFWFELESEPGVPHLDLLMTLERPGQGERVPSGSTRAFLAKLENALPSDWKARWSTATAAADVLEDSDVEVETLTDILCPYG